MGYVCLAPLNWEVRDIFSKEVTFRLRFRRWWGRVNHKIIWKKNIWSRVHSKCRELKVRVAWLLNEFIAHNSWGIVGVMEWSEDKWERKSGAQKRCSTELLGSFAFHPNSMLIYTTCIEIVFYDWNLNFIIYQSTWSYKGYLFFILIFIFQVVFMLGWFYSSDVLR